MKYRNFADYVSLLSDYDERKALCIKRLVRTDCFSYGDIRESAYRAARYLESKGIDLGDRIMIVAPNQPEWGVLFLGGQLRGATIVPVDARSNLETVQGFIERTKPRIIFRGRHVLRELDEKYDTAILDELFDSIANYPADYDDRGLDLDTRALIVFTSGTTAAPKGVVLTQKNILSNIEQVGKVLPIDPDWRFLSILPLSHMYELTAGFLTPLSGGASVHYLPRIAPLAIARALREYSITSVLTVPLLLALFIKRIEAKAEEEGKLKLLKKLAAISKNLPFSIRRVLFAPVHKKLGGKLTFFATGGAPVDPDVSHKWESFGVKVLQGYGLTETSPVLTINTLDDRNLASQGKVIPGAEVRIAKDGEIQAKGDNVFKEYLDNPEATREAMTSDGWFRTGDVGRFDNDGWLYIKGRKKFAIVLPSGLKVFPEDVELVINKRPEIKEAAVVGIKKDEKESVHAVILGDKGDEGIEKAVGEVNAMLEEHQRITSWERFTEEDFPRTRLLKVDRKKVQTWAQDRADKKEEHGPISEKPVDKVQDVLRIVSEKPLSEIIDKVSLGKLGLDSLKRLTVVSLIEEQLGVSLLESQINAETTVEELREMAEKAELIEEKIKRPRWTFWLPVRLLGNIVRDVIAIPLSIFWVSLKVEGKHNLSKVTGPVIFIFNHVDGFDIAALIRALPVPSRNRLAVAAAMDVFKEHKVLAFFGRFLVAAFDFARKEPFLPSLEYMGQLIEKGWNIAVAPEGQLSKDGQLQPFKSGTGMMAVEMQVPVIPVKSIGLFGTMPLHKKFPVKRSKVTVKIGEPITFDPKTSYEVATKRLEQVMREL